MQSMSHLTAKATAIILYSSCLYFSVSIHTLFKHSTWHLPKFGFWTMSLGHWRKISQSFLSSSQSQKRYPEAQSDIGGIWWDTCVAITNHHKLDGKLSATEILLSQSRKEESEIKKCWLGWLTPEVLGRSSTTLAYFLVPGLRATPLTRFIWHCAQSPFLLSYMVFSLSGPFQIQAGLISRSFHLSTPFCSK